MAAVSQHQSLGYLLSLLDRYHRLANTKHCVKQKQMMVSSRPKGDQTWLSKTCFNIFLYNIFPHCSIILTHAYKFLWVPKKDFTPLCSKNSRQKKNCSSEKKICSSEKKSCSSEKKSCSSDFLPTVFSTSSKKKVAAPQAVLIVPTLQWSRCFAGKYRNGAIAIQFEPWQV